MGAGTPKRGWSSKIGRGFLPLTDPSRYNCRPEISKMRRELQKWAEPPKWGWVYSRKDFHYWLWLQPIVIDLHFKITLYKLKIVSSLSKIKYDI